MTSSWADQIKWNADGLVPAIAQDHQTGHILMLAWVNKEALTLAVQEKRAIYWSRSRQKLWRKGEDSGHIQVLHDIYLDCDSDTLIYKIDQVGGIACHTGRESCFYLKLEDNNWKAVQPVIKDPQDIYND